MATKEIQTSSDIGLVPLVVVVLIAAHVVALVYWIYRVATEKPPSRRKAQ